MKVFAMKMDGITVKHVEVEQDLGVMIEHEGKRYRIDVDNYGKLVLRSDTEIVIYPKAANSFCLESR